MKNINLVFGLVCDDVRFEVNGKISIIGESNLFYLPTLPLTIPLCIMTKWSGTPGAKGTVSLRMLSPDSTVPANMSVQEMELAVTDFDTSFGGTIHKIPWQIHTSGVHMIKILLDSEESGRIELMIKKGMTSKN